MKKNQKHIFTFLLILTLTVSSTLSVFASDSQTYAAYDLSKGGTQTFNIEYEDGNSVIITIEEISTNARIDDGSYKITYDNTGFWKAGFYVKISNNQIVSAYSPFYSVVAGAISGEKLTVVSFARANYRFLYRSGLIYYSTGVDAKISGTTLNVSKL